MPIVVNPRLLRSVQLSEPFSSRTIPARPSITAQEILDAKDSRGNNLQNLKIETELAQSLIENPNFSAWLMPFDDRISDYLRANRSHPKVKGFVKNFWSFQKPDPKDSESWLSRVTSYKVFLDYIMGKIDPPGTPLKMLPRKLKDKSTACRVLSDWRERIKGSSSGHEDKLLWQCTRPKVLFADSVRGRKELSVEPRNTRKIGIYAPEDTPECYTDYFINSHPVIQDKFLIDEASPLVKKLRSRAAPLISGVSGTMSYTLRGLVRLGPFTDLEVSNILMGMAAALVAQGYHSFSEIILVNQSMGFQKIPGAEDFPYSHLNFCSQVLADANSLPQPQPSEESLKSAG